MMLTELTTVPPEVLPTQGFKDHLRLGSGFSDDGVQDTVLDGFLRAALAAIEARTGKILISRDFSWVLTKWRDPQKQPLPLAPVNDVQQLAIVEVLGNEVIVPTDRWRLVEDLQRPSIAPTASCLPTIPSGASVKITFEAGFGASWDEIPADLRHAVLMLAAHFYEYRHEGTFDGGTMPFGVSALIERYRTVRLFMGGGK